MELSYHALELYHPLKGSWAASLKTRDTLVVGAEGSFTLEGVTFKGKVTQAVAGSRDDETSLQIRPVNLRLRPYLQFTDMSEQQAVRQLCKSVNLNIDSASRFTTRTITDFSCGAYDPNTALKSLLGSDWTITSAGSLLVREVVKGTEAACILEEDCTCIDTVRVRPLNYVYPGQKFRGRVIRAVEYSVGATRIGCTLSF